MSSHSFHRPERALIQFRTTTIFSAFLILCEIVGLGHTVRRYFRECDARLKSIGEGKS